MEYFDVWERLDELLKSRDQDLVVYVYRINASGIVIKPFLLKCKAWPGLKEVLRDKHHGGMFRIIIRRKITMVFRGDIGIAIPIKKIERRFLILSTGSLDPSAATCLFGSKPELL